MAHRLQYRRDTKANWLKYNPVLMEGEVGYETDTHHQKVGDGVSTYSELEYEVGVGNITQETGDSETLVMSQKVVTEKLSELGSKVSVEVETKLNIGESVLVNKSNVFLLDGYVTNTGAVTIANNFKHATIFANTIKTISFAHANTVHVPTIICRDKNGNIVGLYLYSGVYTIPPTTTRVDLNFFGDGFADEFTIVAKTEKGIYDDIQATNGTYYDITGKEYSSSAFKSTDLIAVIEGQKVLYKAGTQTSGFATILAYNKDKEVISYLESIQGETQEGEYIVPKECSYIRVSYYFKITDAFIRIDVTSAISSLIAKESEDNRMTISDFPFVGYIKVDGSFTEMHNIHSTDFVNVQGYNQIEVFAKVYNAGYCAFYFADKTLCSTFQNKLDKRIVDIPNGAVYVRLCNYDAEVAAPSAILRKVSNHWQNRKIAIYGTSIEAGYPLSSFENNRERVNTYSFMSAAIEQIGAIPLNYAVPSGYICKKAGSPKSFLGSTALDIDYDGTGIQNVNIHNRLLNYIGTAQDADAYLFAYHVNDTLEDNALLDDSEVDYGSLDESTFVGAYNYTLKEIFTAKPNAVVMIASHYSNDGFSNQEPRRYKRVNAILKGIADYWNIPFVDLASSGIIINNGMINNYTAYMTDAGHPAAYNKAEGLTLVTRITERVKAALLSI